MRIITAAGEIRYDTGNGATAHSHVISDTSGLQAALDNKAALVHTHAQSDVTGLVAALAGKSAIGHTHTASEITDLTSHTHVKANITDLETITQTPAASVIPKSLSSGFLSLSWLQLATGSIFIGVSGVPAAVALSGDATLATTGVLTLATVNSNVGAFVMANVTVNAKGLVTAAASGNPMTTAGDIIVGGVSGAPTRLAGNAGGTLQVLTSQSSAFAWQNYVINLNEDVEVTTPAAGHLFIYDGTDGRWENKAASGDIAVAETGAFTLPTVNSNVGTFNYATITVDGKGRITAASGGTSPLTTLASLTDVLIASVANAHLLIYDNADSRWENKALSGDATIAATGALTLTTVNSNVGSFTYSSITVDAKGRITAASNGAAPTTSFAALTDVNLTSIADGQIAIYDSGTARWRNFSLSGAITMNDSGVTTLAGIDTHSDVTIASIANAHLLIYDNADSQWENKALSGDATIAATGALTLTTVNSDVGSYTNVSLTVDAKGRITACSTGSAGASTLDALTDVTLASVANTQILIYETSTAQWKNRTMSGDATISSTGALTIGTNTIGTTKLSQLTANSIIGNPTAALANIITMTASAGQVLRMNSSGVMNWGSTVELGVSGGGGTFKCFATSGGYFEITGGGALSFFHSATAKIDVTIGARTTWTFASSNTVDINGSDFVGSSKTVKLREIDVCDAGVAKKMLVLCSATY